MSYEEARAKYATLGVDADAALETLAKVPVSLHCWQGDDVGGFDQKGPLSGGIQTTGNYPGKARAPEELMADIDKVLALCPGTKKINIHACYAVFEPGEWVDRDKIEPRHFRKWVEFCKARGLGADFNPTFFGHPKCDPLTLASPCEETRRFWVEHGKCCIRIAQYLADELGQPCVINLWAGDGMKDVPADRLGPRLRYRKSFDEIIAEPFDKTKVYVTVEAKLFGIGVESYTVGSGEFCLKYAAENKANGVISLMDSGHYHPTEVISDKISALLAYDEKIALHVSRPVRWDSDHVVLFDDETKEIAREIVRCKALGRVFIALDYFDASINRIAAWTTGFRNMQKALLYALLQPCDALREMQDRQDFTRLLVMQEELKFYPFAEIWAEYCRRQGAPQDGAWFDDVLAYERDVLSKRV